MQNFSFFELPPNSVQFCSYLTWIIFICIETKWEGQTVNTQQLKNKDHPNIQREFSAFISALHIRNAADTGDVLSTEWLLQDDLSGNWPVYDFSVCIILVYWQVIQEAFYAVQLSGIYWQETTTATTPV